MTAHKHFGVPDEVREFPNARAEILSVGGSEVGRMTFQPWVVGDEPVVLVDWYGTSNYARGG
jgi:hypothetical protein